MDKKKLYVEIPEQLKAKLDDLSKKSGRKQNVIVSASMHHLLNSNIEQQEELIRDYLVNFAERYKSK